MTIKRRINLSFLVIIVLFALNLAIYFWNSHRQANSADALRRAIGSPRLAADGARFEEQLGDARFRLGGDASAAEEEGKALQCRVVSDGGLSKFRRAAETPSNPMLEARARHKPANPERYSCPAIACPSRAVPR